MTRKHIKMAICYDFDGTLSPGNMQEYDFIPDLNLNTKKFWEEVSIRARESEADNILVYMCLMLEKAMASHNVQISKEAFASYGGTVDLFEGVESFFPRINEFARQHGVALEHYIISSGIREMIEGTPIAKYFNKIYASSFMYDQHNVAHWPGLAVNYTTKTQFLFRINKGILDVWDNHGINTFVPKDERTVPFSKMIYVGDGATDVPCMKLVKEQGGHSIAVYKPRSSPSKSQAYQLLSEDRVNFVAPAKYEEDGDIDEQIKGVIRKVAADSEIERLEIASISNKPEGQ